MQIAFEQLQIASGRILKFESNRMILRKMGVFSLASGKLVIRWKARVEIEVC
jgi:hypothetical protein